MKTYNKELKKAWDKKLKEEYSENYEQEYEFKQDLLKEIKKELKRTNWEYLDVGIELIKYDDKINDCMVSFTTLHRSVNLFKLKDLTDKKKIKEIAEQSIFLRKQTYKKFLEKELEKLNK